MSMTDESFGVVPIHATAGTRRFLLVHQKKGHWGFPKGHAEAGESDIQAALRELAEETGITDCELVDDEMFIERYMFINKQGKRIDKTVTFFIGRVGDPAVAVQPEEVQAYAWLDADEARQRLTFPEARELLGRVIAYLEQA